MTHPIRSNRYIDGFAVNPSGSRIGDVEAVPTRSRVEAEAVVPSASRSN
jgi:hypothetical protein